MSIKYVFNPFTGKLDAIDVSSATGVAFETPVGTIDGSNATFTVSNIPTAIMLNGLTYFETDGYTLSGLTITMLVVPPTGSTLRSLY